jgi:hypothetical protein
VVDPVVVDPVVVDPVVVDPVMVDPVVVDPVVVDPVAPSGSDPDEEQASATSERSQPLAPSSSMIHDGTPLRPARQEWPEQDVG